MSNVVRSSLEAIRPTVHKDSAVMQAPCRLRFPSNPAACYRVCLATICLAMIGARADCLAEDKGSSYQPNTQSAKEEQEKARAREKELKEQQALVERLIAEQVQQQKIVSFDVPDFCLVH